MKKYYRYLKLIIITMGTQALIYFLIKFFIKDYNAISSFLNVPLIKPFVFFYDSWYPFIIMNTFLVFKSGGKTFNYLIITMLLVAFVSQITFLVYPTILSRPNIEVNNIIDWLLDFTYKSDTPAVNCLPSMHCNYCFVTSYYILQSSNLKKRNKVFILAYSFMIVLSTLFIKQHIIEDVILAFIYSSLVITLVHFNKKNIDKLFDKLNI